MVYVISVLETLENDPNMQCIHLGVTLDRLRQEMEENDRYIKNIFMWHLIISNMNRNKPNVQSKPSTDKKSSRRKKVNKMKKIYLQGAAKHKYNSNINKIYDW